MKQVTEFQNYLKTVGACKEARDWAANKSSEQAWQQCERPDWLLWWVEKNNKNTKQQIVKCTIQFARLTIHLVPKDELRPLKAIEAVEAWVANPTEKNRIAAKDAAHAAIYAAYAAHVAYAAYAAHVAYAAYAAINAADAAYAYAAYANAADATSLKEIQQKFCDIIRKELIQPWYESDPA